MAAMTYADKVLLGHAVLNMEEILETALIGLNEHGCCQIATELKEHFSKITDAMDPIFSDDSLWDALGITGDDHDDA